MTADSLGLDRYLAELTKVVFQSGMGRAVVESKWSGFEEAFEGFDPHRVAELTPGEVDALVTDRRIIRNRRKVDATIANAARLLDLDDEHGDGVGIRRWLRSFATDDERDRAVVDAFAFVGPTGVRQFLYGVGEDVPIDCSADRTTDGEVTT